jgi:lysophospholipid acyltransferase (LPLAT)-like uncharacterized protein
VKALRDLLEAGSRRYDLAVTPDGPRGPRERVQPGVAYLAKRLGLPIVPVGVSARPSFWGKSWDRFMIPFPFSRCTVVYGEPVFLDDSVSKEDVDSAAAELEIRLKEVTGEADGYCGYRTE